MPNADDSFLEDRLLPTYQQLRAQLGEGPCVVVLHLGAQRSGIAVGTGAQVQTLRAMDLGLERTARQYFRTTPPSALAMEHAIQGVEDVVMPLHTIIPREARLFSRDEALREVAALAGVPEQGDMVLSLEAMESLFSRLASRVQGTPASQLGLPESNAFAAGLLILREFMHHLRFDRLTVQQPRP